MMMRLHRRCSSTLIMLRVGGAGVATTSNCDVRWLGRLVALVDPPSKRLGLFVTAPGTLMVAGFGSESAPSVSPVFRLREPSSFLIL